MGARSLKSTLLGIKCLDGLVMESMWNIYNKLLVIFGKVSVEILSYLVARIFKLPRGGRQGIVASWSSHFVGLKPIRNAPLGCHECFFV